MDERMRLAEKLNQDETQQQARWSYRDMVGTVQQHSRIVRPNA
jgi:hypothetical protein